MECVAAGTGSDRCGMVPSGGTSPSAGSFDGWGNLTPYVGLSPSPRYSAAMVYDANSTAGYVVLFGGEGPNGALGDTWEFQNEAWTNVTPSPLTSTDSPTPRFGAAMAYDSTSGTVILFGGANASYSGTNQPLLGDTWQFSAGAWSRLCAACVPTATEPGPRVDAAISDDPAADGVVLFGGLTITAGLYQSLNDTWVFASPLWTNISPPDSPPPRFESGLAFNSTAGPLVLFGGCSEANSLLAPACASPLGDLWEFSSDQWTQVSGTPAPGPRAGFGFAASSSLGEILAFGGSGESGWLNETWNLTEGRWNDLTDSLLWSPSPRTNGALAFDSATNSRYFVLFGGWNGTYLEETWAYPSPFSPLRVSAPLASPTEGDAGEEFWLNVTPAGGAGGYTRTWYGLPPGCVSTNTSTLTCRPEEPVFSPSTYSVSVRIRDSVGSIVWSPATQIVVNMKPLVAIVASPNVGEVPLNTTLTADVEYGTPPYTFRWTFGDGHKGTGNPVVHEYRSTGSFTVSVNGTDSRGEYYVAYFKIHAVRALTVQISLSANPVAVGSATTIGAEVTGGYSPFSFAWTGLPASCPSTATSASVSCKPTVPGTYRIGVQVTDFLGDVANSSAVLNVSAPSGPLVHAVPYVALALPVTAVVILGIAWSRRRARRRGRAEETAEPTSPPPPR